MLRLSEAMRLGALLKPQGFGKLYDLRSKGTCAFGAAFDAIGRLHEAVLQCGNLDTEWQPLIDTIVVCPHCDRVRGPLESMVVHLNDGHQWTRERIANWVETIEGRAPPASPEAQVAASSCA